MNMDEKTKLGLLERFKIWRARRYASKLYRKYYKENDDGLGEEDFIEQYLEEQGLKQKSFPKESSNSKNNFMSKYSTEKTVEEQEYEIKSREKKIYYDFDGEKYELPYLFSDVYIKQIESKEFDPENSLPLITYDEINYIIDVQKMTPEEKNKMLKILIDRSLSQIGEETYAITSDYPDSELRETFPALVRKASYNDYIASKKVKEGDFEEANIKLEGLAKKILDFHREMTKNEQDKIR